MKDGIALRRAVGIPGGRVRILEGALAGRDFPCVSYRQFGAPLREGGEVVVNAVGVEMGLGTGGVVFAVPEPQEDCHPPDNDDHFVKLPYTPLQFAARTEHAGDSVRKPLTGVPVVVLPLHSHLAAACCALREAKPDSAAAFVWQEGGALGVGFSKSVAALKESGLLGAVVSSGSCFGGDIEAPNIYAALEAASRVDDPDILFVGIGPGVVGSDSRYGHGGMSQAIALNAAAALGASPVLVARISGADGRDRHRGISHHTLTALDATLTGCRVALPESPGITEEEIPPPHEAVFVEGASAAGLEARFGLTFETMGRSYEQDRVFFDAAAAGAALALSGNGVS